MFPLTDLSILFTALLVIGFLCLGLIVLLGVAICKRPGRYNLVGLPDRPVPQVPPAEDPEVTLASLAKKMNDIHAEEVRIFKANRIEQYMLTLWAFALATLALGLAVSALGGIGPAVFLLLIAVFFAVLGYFTRRHLNENYNDVKGHGFWED